MINCRELRIGNLLKYSGLITSGISEVECINRHSDLFRDNSIRLKSGAHEGECSPIPLTPDVFEACDFTFHHNDCGNGVLCIKDIHVGTEFQYKIYPKELGSAEEPTGALKLKYLHQLQNLIFAITGEELSVDTTKIK